MLEKSKGFMRYLKKTFFSNYLFYVDIKESLTSKYCTNQDCLRRVLRNV